MNSAVRPIFNKSFVEKIDLQGLMNSAHDPLENINALLKKRKKEKKM